MYQYEHGGNERFKKENILDFSANINPMGLPEGVEQAIISAISECVNYPDYESKELRKKISEFDFVPVEHIFCANGASDIIFRLVSSIKPNKAMVFAPSFLDYTRALKSFGADVYTYMLYEEDDFYIKEDILEKIREEKFDLIFLCNPNNPTGVLIEKKLLVSIIKECKAVGTYLVVDECFLDFIWEEEMVTVKRLTKEYDNLIVLKAFTKIFAFAGIRLGYAICSNQKLLDWLYFSGPDWSVSAIAQAAGIAALNNPYKYIEKSRKRIDAEKSKIVECLKQNNYKVIGSKALYLFFKNPYSFDLAKELYDTYHICIRSCENYIGLDKSFYRMGIGIEKDNNRLIHCFNEITENKI